MASKSAIPQHLKAAAVPNGEASDFARKHHGKTQSHVVRSVPSYHHQVIPVVFLDSEC
jgi:hypothetical protein